MFEVLNYIKDNDLSFVSQIDYLIITYRNHNILNQLQLSIQIRFKQAQDQNLTIKLTRKEQDIILEI